MRYIIIVICAVLLAARSASAQEFDAILAGMGAGDYTELSALVNGHGGDSAPVKKAAGRKSQGSDADMVAAMAGDVRINGALDYMLDAYATQDIYRNPDRGRTQYNYGNNGTDYPYHNWSGSMGLIPNSKYSHLVSGSAQLPIIGRVTSNYGWRPSFGRMHKGIDLSLQVGDTVRASMAGTVSKVSEDPRGYGRYVCITHPNGLETRYAHLSQFIAREGQRIYPGDPVGLGGSTGNSTGPHLHFEVRVNGDAIDPRAMFNFEMKENGGNRYRTLAELDELNPRVEAASTAYMTRQMRNKVNEDGTPITSITPPAKKSTYIVRAGDTLNSVAMKNGISVLTLCRLNMLSSTDALEPGRMLKLR